MGLPIGVQTRNGWYLEIAGAPPDLFFIQLSGLERGGDSIQRTDGKTLTRQHFNDGVNTYGTDVTMVRSPDNSEADDFIEDLVTKCRLESYKFDMTVFKMQGKNIVRRMKCSGVRVAREELPQLDTEADGQGARYDITYHCTVDYWEYVK